MKRLADTFDASGAGRTLYLARAQSFVASLAGDGYGADACAIVLRTLVEATDQRIAFEASLRPPSAMAHEIAGLLRELSRHLEDELSAYTARSGDPRPREGQPGRLVTERLLIAVQAYRAHFST